jgi:hypothetical protein
MDAKDKNIFIFTRGKLQDPPCQNFQKKFKMGKNISNVLSVKQQKLDKEGANDSSLASWLWPTGAPTE